MGWDWSQNLLKVLIGSLRHSPGYHWVHKSSLCSQWIWKPLFISLTSISLGSKKFSQILTRYRWFLLGQKAFLIFSLWSKTLYKFSFMLAAFCRFWMNSRAFSQFYWDHRLTRLSLEPKLAIGYRSGLRTTSGSKCDLRPPPKSLWGLSLPRLSMEPKPFPDNHRV